MLALRLTRASDIESGRGFAGGGTTALARAAGASCRVPAWDLFNQLRAAGLDSCKTSPF